MIKADTLKNAVKFLKKEARKNITWKYKKRWTDLDHQIKLVDGLLINTSIDEMTREILLNFYVKLVEMRKRFKSKVMPYKAYKKIIKPLDKISKKL